MTTAPFAPAPPVVTWYKVYAAIMSFIYLILIGVGLLIMFVPEIDDSSEAEKLFVGVLLISLGGFFLALFAVSLFLPRKPWVWIYDIVLICLGFTSCLTLPFCIALLIYWLKPETKAAFGRT